MADPKDVAQFQLKCIEILPREYLNSADQDLWEARVSACEL